MKANLLLRVALAIFMIFLVIGCGNEVSDPVMESDEATVGIPLTDLMAETLAKGDSNHGNYNFVVEIDNFEVASFSEASVLEAEVEVVEYREGTDTTTSSRKLPGRVKYGNLVLKRGVTQSTQLFDWFKGVVNGMVERKNMSIILLSNSREEVARWTFLNAWPCKYKGPDLDAAGNEVAIEMLEIAHEGMGMEATSL